MTPTATRFLTSAAIAALLLTAGAAVACDHSAKSAKAGSCPAKGASYSACKSTHACAPAATRSAAVPAAKKSGAAAAAKKAAPSQAGMWAQIDPETGKLGGMPVRSYTVTEGLPLNSDEPVTLTEVRLPGGGYTVDLQGTGELYTVLRIDAQGHRVMTCSPNPRAVLKAAPVATTSTAYPEK